MAETDILNPLDWRLQGFVFNPNPSYGFSRRIGQNRSLARPRLGPFVSRDVGNGGHTFPLSWVNTDLSTAQRVIKFFHDFRSGYFTFINPDWGGRHFVGRFTEEPEAIETGNGKWTIQGATFEEIPTARMLQYPCDWVHDGHPLNVVDDFFQGGVPTPRVALMQGGWVLQISPAAPGASATDATAYEAFNATPGAGDWAQTAYVGWGFRMGFRLANTLGQVNVYLDGVEVVSALDLSTGACASSTGVATLAVNGTASVTLTCTNVPLDMHRVKVQYQNSSITAAGVSIIFPQLEYIY